jgi:hypothetical protein
VLPSGGFSPVATTRLKPVLQTGERINVKPRITITTLAIIALCGDEIYVLELKFVPVPIVTNWFTTHRVRKVSPEGTVVTLVTVGGGGGYLLSGMGASLMLGVWTLWRRRRRRKAQKERQT